MKLTKQVGTVVIELDAEWEREVMDWLWESYGEHFLKHLLSRMLYEKQRAKVAIEIRKEMEKRLGTDNRGSSVDAGAVRTGDASKGQGDSGSQGTD